MTADLYRRLVRLESIAARMAGELRGLRAQRPARLQTRTWMPGLWTCGAETKQIASGTYLEFTSEEIDIGAVAEFVVGDFARIRILRAGTYLVQLYGIMNVTDAPTFRRHYGFQLVPRSGSFDSVSRVHHVDWDEVTSGSTADRTFVTWDYLHASQASVAAGLQVGIEKVLYNSNANDYITAHLSLQLVDY